MQKPPVKRNAVQPFNGSSCILAVTGLAIEARIARQDGVVAMPFGGRRRSSEDVVKAIGREVIGVISIGIAGGLDTDLIAGSWLVARSIVTTHARWATDEQWAKRLLEALPGARYVDI